MQNNNLDDMQFLIATSPLLVALLLCVAYFLNALIFHKEIPDIGKILPLALSCVGTYSGLMLVASVFIPIIRQLILEEYLNLVFFIGGLVITLTSLKGMHDSMVCLHKHDDNKLRARHVFGIIFTLIVFIAVIAYIFFVSPDPSIAAAPKENN